MAQYYTRGSFDVLTLKFFHMENEVLKKNRKKTTRYECVLIRISEFIFLKFSKEPNFFKAARMKHVCDRTSFKGKAKVVHKLIPRRLLSCFFFNCHQIFPPSQLFIPGDMVNICV